MQLEESSSRSPRSEGERQGVSPVKAFLVLLALAIAAGVFLMLTRSAPVANDGSTATATSEPDYSLTNAEAITRFKELNDERIAAYETRDRSQLAQIFVRDSRIYRTVDKEIASLTKDKVLSRTKFRQRNIEVIGTSDSIVRILERVLVEPKFVSEATGKDVTGRERPQLQSVVWRLRLINGQWLIASADLKKAAYVD